MDSVAPVCVFVESHCEFALPCACLSFWQEIAFRSYVREGRRSGRRSDVSFVHIKVLYERNTCPTARSSMGTLAVLPKNPRQIGPRRRSRSLSRSPGPFAPIWQSVFVTDGADKLCLSASAAL